MSSKQKYHHYVIQWRCLWILFHKDTSNLRKTNWQKDGLRHCIAYSSLSVWEQQHAWLSAPLAQISGHRRPPTRIRPPSHTTSISAPMLGWTMASPRGRVLLRSVELFHYKLLPWSWLRQQWRTDWLLWRSLLMRSLIFPPFQLRQ